MTDTNYGPSWICPVCVVEITTVPCPNAAMHPYIPRMPALVEARGLLPRSDWDQRYEAEIARIKALPKDTIKIVRHPAMEAGRQFHELILGEWDVIENI